MLRFDRKQQKCVKQLSFNIKIILKKERRVNKASQVVLVVKNLPANVGDIRDMGMATHPRILAWRIPWTEKPGRLQSTGLHRVRHD